MRVFFVPTCSITMLIGLVTPCSVRSPVTANAVLPLRLTAVLLNVMSVNCLASKKSPLLRCWLRPSWLVSTFSAFAEMVNEDAAGLPWLR